jgi:recombination protein RecR
MTELERLIQLLAKLPGLGPRSARRAALHLVKRKEVLMLPLVEAMGAAADKVHPCPVCGNLDTEDPCGICRDPRREPGVLCVVEEVADLWALERAAAFRGRYHVLGGTLPAANSGRSFSPPMPPSTARPRRITSPTGWRRPALPFRASPMACRSAANSTISTMAP